MRGPHLLKDTKHGSFEADDPGIVLAVFWKGSHASMASSIILKSQGNENVQRATLQHQVAHPRKQAMRIRLHAYQP
jgi:hypothetical protein